LLSCFDDILRRSMSISNEARPSAPMAEVSIEAPARLHFGFVDLSADGRRRFGSLGVALKAPSTRLRARRAARVSAHGPCAARAAAFAERLQAQLGLPGGVALEIDRALPEHAGLGAGTQLALAVGTAVARLYGLALRPHDLARRLERGRRSAVGLGAFEQGGLIVDGGRGADPARPPPIVARLPLPAAWTWILIFDDRCQGLSGAEELAAFARLPPASVTEAQALSRLVLMDILPAAAEGDLAAFGAGLTRLQDRVGDYFAPAQGGQRYRSPEVARVLGWLREHAAASVGQSSWGPTGFALAADRQQAETLVSAATAAMPEAAVRYVLSGTRNVGAAIHCTAVRRPLKGARVSA
jgi:beta-ribofuranosylaminobenzene 5'-phosphate synthase